MRVGYSQQRSLTLRENTHPSLSVTSVTSLPLNGCCGREQSFKIVCTSLTREGAAHSRSLSCLSNMILRNNLFNLIRKLNLVEIVFLHIVFNLIRIQFLHCSFFR